jgi:hypothetical protein
VSSATYPRSRASQRPSSCGLLDSRTLLPAAEVLVRWATALPPVPLSPGKKGEGTVPSHMTVPPPGPQTAGAVRHSAGTKLGQKLNPAREELNPPLGKLGDDGRPVRPRRPSSSPSQSSPESPRVSGCGAAWHACYGGDNRYPPHGRSWSNRGKRAAVSRSVLVGSVNLDRETPQKCRALRRYPRPGSNRCHRRERAAS